MNKTLELEAWQVELLRLLPKVELVDTDGEPMESAWHREEMNLLIGQVRYHLRDRQDYFVGGNMFIYFSEQQARNRDVRGPDFFYVAQTRPDPLRPYWVVWEEGRSPDVIVELLSPTTATADRTTKLTIYEQVFRTPDYFCYEPATRRLEGWHLVAGRYVSLQANEWGWLWCQQLNLWLGEWEGVYENCPAVWLRFRDLQGQVVPVAGEAERQRADAAAQRADAAEAELARLRALLAEKEGRAGSA